MNTPIDRHVYDAAQLLDLGAPQVRPDCHGVLAVRVPEGISPLSLRRSAVGQELIRQDVTWYDRSTWASEPLPPGMYDVRFLVPESSRRTFAEQMELLLPGEEPLPLVLAELTLLCCHARGLASPLRGGWVRCRERADGGCRVVLSWGDGRLRVGIDWDDLHDDSMWFGVGIVAG
jgi:hypothetical protein